MTGSVLFSGLPSAEFYDYVRGLEYGEDPDYDRWQGAFNDLFDPYNITDGSFDFASAWGRENTDDNLVGELHGRPKPSSDNFRRNQVDA
jgi:hypothetical protein